MLPWLKNYHSFLWLITFYGKLSAVEKLFMACCTMQPEDDAALPRGFDSEDCEVYQKNSDSNSVADVNIDGSIGTSSSISNLFGGSSCIGNSGGAGVSNQIGNFFASSGTSNGPLGCTEAMDSLGNYVKKKFKQLINRFL